MLRSVIGLFIKESRQGGNGWKAAVAVVAMCLIVHTSFYLLGLYMDDDHITLEGYLFVAVFSALAFTWAIASCVYAVEHETNTFGFLRNLPVSPLTVAIGKVGWVICGATLVLVCNLLLCVGWVVLLGIPAPPHFDISGGLIIFAPCFLEVLVWGIFWSTRCRNTIVAVIATAFSVILSLWAMALFFIPYHATDADVYILFLFSRLLVVTLVGLLAAWGALRWFEFSAKNTQRVWIPRNFVFARYPQSVQPPFLALIHQHLRHVSLVYPLGVLCFALFSLGCLFVSFMIRENLLFRGEYDVFLGFGCLFTMIGMIIFWGNIFGHDQRKDSYKFLSRIGVYEGDVWWSRMLPAILFYFPVLPCWILYFYTQLSSWEEFALAAQIVFTAWFTLMALGAFVSISSSKQMAGIGGTFALGYLLLTPWLMLFLVGFGSSPLWTTVPVAAAFLIASRMRAGYWLREITTWRSRLIPLIPVFAAALAVCIDLPFVRVYSVPYVSQQQLDTYLAGTPDAYKEELIKHYTEQRDYARSVFSGAILEGMDSRDSFYTTYFCLGLMPWEEARRERILRCQVVAALAESGYVRDGRSRSIRNFYVRIQRGSPSYPIGGLWDGVW